MPATEPNGATLEGIRGRIRHWQSALAELEAIQERLQALRDCHSPLLEEARADKKINLASEQLTIASARLERSLAEDDEWLLAEAAN